MGFSLASGVDPLFRSGSKDQRIHLPSAKTRLHSRNPHRLTKTGWPEWVVVIKLGYRSGIVSRDHATLGMRGGEDRALVVLSKAPNEQRLLCA
jgi:hypothetical protein